MASSDKSRRKIGSATLWTSLARVANQGKDTNAIFFNNSLYLNGKSYLKFDITLQPNQNFAFPAFHIAKILSPKTTAIEVSGNNVKVRMGSRKEYNFVCFQGKPVEPECPIRKQDTTDVTALLKKAYQMVSQLIIPVPTGALESKHYCSFYHISNMTYFMAGHGSVCIAIPIGNQKIPPIGKVENTMSILFEQASYIGLAQNGSIYVESDDHGYTICFKPSNLLRDPSKLVPIIKSEMGTVINNVLVQEFFHALIETYNDCKSGTTAIRTKLIINNDTITITSRSTEESKTIIDCKYDGPPISLELNSDVDELFLSMVIASNMCVDLQQFDILSNGIMRFQTEELTYLISCKKD
jgi:hypothetical protein